MVDYNEAAIKFYERNKFITLRTEIDHYVIKNEKYDAIILYKMLNREQILADSFVEDDEVEYD